MPRLFHDFGTAFLTVTAAVIGLALETGCRPPTPTPIALGLPSVRLLTTDVAVPQHVRRLAVWYPRTKEQDVAYGYTRLEEATFQLKRQRSWIKIVDRRNVEQLTEEQRFQLSGRVADDSAVQVGKWLGADSMVLFRIEGPSWRERLLGRMYGKMPPFVVSSKIISLESGEVLYHDVVSATPIPGTGEWSDYATDYELRPAMHSALDQALSSAILHLRHSFR
ncbi:MAG TPA: hypothetical protein VJL88_12905 [Nitrospira sp.]|nr:hypothetical protein [Nitrospira sp.]